MAELLVMAIDKANADPYQDALCYKANDVVTIQADGYAWSASERALPFIIVSLPGIAPDQIAAFVAADAGDRQQSIIARRRAYRFDMPTWQAMQHLPSVALNVVLTQLLKTKPRLTDPNILGAPQSVL